MALEASIFHSAPSGITRPCPSLWPEDDTVLTPAPSTANFADHDSGSLAYTVKNTFIEAADIETEESRTRAIALSFRSAPTTQKQQSAETDSLLEDLLSELQSKNLCASPPGKEPSILPNVTRLGNATKKTVECLELDRGAPAYIVNSSSLQRKLAYQ